jgi:muramoyltetrapeptide carboxypeptidase
MPLTIALPALMGHVRDPLAYQRALDYFAARGNRVLLDPNALAKHHYFSAPDKVRLDTFHAMLRERPDVLMPLRAGYGITRLLPDIDWTLVKVCGAKFCGFSDFTGFNLAALREGIVTYSGPLSAVEFGAKEIDPFTEMQCWSTLATGTCEVSVSFSSETAQTAPQVSQVSERFAAQTLTGLLWGTNLSMIAHLVGTPYLPNVRDGILLVEDVGEEPYAIERALMQLWHAGILQQQKAIIFGVINGYAPDDAAAKAYPIEAVIADLRTRVQCPVLTDFPFGHVATKATLPIGGAASLQIAQAGYTLRASAHP